MATKRSYADRCGIARALDVVGERWSLLVVRELLLGPKRFTDLRNGLPGVSADVLALRLRELEEAGVVTRATLPPPAGSRVYALTDRGRRLEPVLLSLGRWGSAEPFRPRSGGMSVDAFAVALKTLFDAVAADGTSATYQLILDGQPFSARVTAGQLQLARGEAENPDATIATDPATLAGILWHGGRLQQAIRAGTAQISGDRHLARQFLTLFPQAAPGR